RLAHQAEVAPLVHADDGVNRLDVVTGPDRASRVRWRSLVDAVVRSVQSGLIETVEDRDFRSGRRGGPGLGECVADWSRRRSVNWEAGLSRLRRGGSRGGGLKRLRYRPARGAP